MPPPDPRHVPGNTVHSKAIHIRSLAECSRRYGSNNKTKLIQGVVQSASKERPQGANRSQWMITVEYDFGNGEKTIKTLSSRSVIAGPLPLSIDEQCTSATTATASAERATDATATQQLPAADLNTQQHPSTDETGAAVPPPQPPEPSASIPMAAQQPQPTVIVHEQQWWDDNLATKIPIRGPHSNVQWHLRDAIGNVYRKSSDRMRRLSKLDYFLLMFPPSQLDEMVPLTNIQLRKKGVAETSKSEIVKWFGVLLLMTRYEFRSRQSLWSTIPQGKYRSAPAFGKTGMSRNRFVDLSASVRWSEQPDDPPEGMSPEQYRWLLVDGFVSRFNQHRESTFSPAWSICVDESMSRWYGIGGNWIDAGLPMYVAIDRKPENGCEIQNSACGVSGVMLRLKLVKSAEEESTHANENTHGIPHGAQVLAELVRPWGHTDRVICADSYFASVAATRHLKQMGLRFIGVVKTATKKFPMAWLQQVELHQRGDVKGLVAKDPTGVPELLCFVWMDRDRRYFITNVSSLDEGIPFYRSRLRQVERGLAPQMVEFAVPQPKAAEIYYSTCGKIDQSNRVRQDDIKLEKKFETKDWSMRVNSSIFSLVCVDTWYVYKECTETTEDIDEFVYGLAEEMIDNNISFAGRIRTRLSSPGACSDVSSLTGASGVHSSSGPHVTPTKRFKSNNSKHRYQGRCTVCGVPSTFCCSVCRAALMPGLSDSKTYICHPTLSGRHCFGQHMEQRHQELME